VIISEDDSYCIAVSFHYDPQLVQEILGYKDSKTTEIYSHMSAQSLGKIKSPLDSIDLKKGGDERRNLSLGVYPNSSADMNEIPKMSLRSILGIGAAVIASLDR
jgi:hypothetical protein